MATRRDRRHLHEHPPGRSSSPASSAQPMAALIGDTWLTTTTSRSCASSSRSSHAARTRTPSVANDSPPPGTKCGSARHEVHTSGGHVGDRSAVERAVVELDPPLVDRHRPTERGGGLAGARPSGLATTRASAGIEPRQGRRLATPELRQRRVGAPEEQAAGVGVGLAVAHEHEHRATLPGPRCVATTIRRPPLLSCARVPAPRPRAGRRARLVLRGRGPGGVGAHPARDRAARPGVAGPRVPGLGVGLARADDSLAAHGYRASEIDAIDYDATPPTSTPPAASTARSPPCGHAPARHGSTS